MKKTFTISVTAQDIKQGQTNGVIKCAIDLAIGRRFRGIGSWGYDVGSVNHTSYKTATKKESDRVRKFITAHDAKQDVQPFKFKVVGG